MAAQVTGRVHSVESFGTVDGPGVRFVVFLQGCPMRCLYCHNPDTWDPGGGVPTTVEELLAQYARNEAFYRKGGITVTGGEPLLQIEFVTALFREAKRRGIHTCLDTSGATFRPEDAAALAQFDALCAVTDLVLLDIKQTDPAAHRRLTGRENGNILAFARYLAQKEVPVWVRHVVVPGLTDSEAGWNALLCREAGAVQLVEKASLLRQAAYEQGLRPRSPRTAAFGGRFALHASALALRGVAGSF